jgi:hypothetical protein
MIAALPPERTDAPAPSLHSVQLGHDLPLSLFSAAFQGSYFNPESAGGSHRAGHLAFFAGAVQQVGSAADTLERQAVALRLLEDFKQKYADRVKSQLGSESRFVSWHIAGRSRYPVGRMAKRRDVADRKQQELDGWRTLRLRRILGIIAQVGRTRTSRLEDIQAKLEHCEAKQQRMKAVNALLRKFKYEDSPALRVALEPFEITGALVSALLSPDCLNRRGFADFELTNNGAQIRRWRAELETEQQRLTRAEAQPKTERMVNGVRIEEDIEDNRLRLYYPSKPDAATIAKLKRHGWRWSRTNTAWQRILTNDARYNLEHVILQGGTA